MAGSSRQLDVCGNEVFEGDLRVENLENSSVNMNYWWKNISCFFFPLKVQTFFPDLSIFIGSQVDCELYLWENVETAIKTY